MKRYAMHRLATAHYDTNVLEDVTVHNVWELCQKHWTAYSTSKLNALQRKELRELFPHAFDFTLHNSIYGNMQITRLDCVAFEYEGACRIGKFVLCVGIDWGDKSDMLCWIELWTHAVNIPGFADCVCNCNLVQVNASALLDALTHRFSGDGSTCVVALPFHITG